MHGTVGINRHTKNDFKKPKKAKAFSENPKKPIMIMIKIKTILMILIQKMIMSPSDGSVRAAGQKDKRYFD